MGCCTSSPHARRRYQRDPGDADEVEVPLRYFGSNRVGSNLVPDDIDGLPSTHYLDFLEVDPREVLYEAEIDHGKAFRCLRFIPFLVYFPPVTVWCAARYGVTVLLQSCLCDEACCWVRKEYSTRTFYRVHANRIEFNQPTIRIPYGCLGCGSWNADAVTTHPFDRGAFGFSRVQAGSKESLCGVWPVYGGSVARHRCQCNGPLWNRMFTDCGGWWCDEWICQVCFCSYRYTGLSNPDEVAFASAIALQAYFEGRRLTRQDMERCLEFWATNIAEQTDPIRRKRPVCCEPYIVPCCYCSCCYSLVHPKRSLPYGDEETTWELKEVYKKYSTEAESQVENYKNFYGPVRYSTVCRALGCRRVCGRKGCFFCTEGCRDCNRKAGEPAPPFEVHDFDDSWDASSVLMKVIGPPPENVVIRRWRWNPETKENVLETYPEGFKESEDEKNV